MGIFFISRLCWWEKGEVYLGGFWEGVVLYHLGRCLSPLSNKRREAYRGGLFCSPASSLWFQSREDLTSGAMAAILWLKKQESGGDTNPGARNCYFTDKCWCGFSHGYVSFHLPITKCVLTDLIPDFLERSISSICSILFWLSVYIHLIFLIIK